MGFFDKKNGEPRSRRSERLRLLRVRDFGLTAAAAVAVAAALFTAHHNGSFKKIGGWIEGETLTRTAAAGFKVNDILVTGRMQIPDTELLERLTIKEGMPIFGVSIAEAQKSLAGIPWVDSVTISRRLPDKIIVALKERAPAALWQYRKKISLIDKDGAVLSDGNLDAFQQLPLVVGEDAPQHANELVSLLAAEPALAQRLVSAVRIGGRRWDLRLQDNITVKLPEQDVELALRRLMSAEEQKNIFARNISSVDLRQPEKMIVTSAATPNTTADKKTQNL